MHVAAKAILTLCWACCRAEGRFQLSDGWKPFAQHWNLGHGEQLQLSRCFVSGGCIWLDVKILQHSLNGAPIATTQACCEHEAFQACTCAYSEHDDVDILHL